MSMLSLSVQLTKKEEAWTSPKGIRILGKTALGIILLDCPRISSRFGAFRMCQRACVYVCARVCVLVVSRETLSFALEQMSAIL